MTSDTAPDAREQTPTDPVTVVVDPTSVASGRS
jgi:hypothetical protein